MDWSLLADFSSKAWYVSCKGQEDFATMLLCAALVECPLPPQTPLSYAKLPLPRMFRAALGPDLGTIFDAAWADLTSSSAKANLDEAQFQGIGETVPSGSRAEPVHALRALPCRGSLLSNLGCIHLLIGKPILAALLFQESLRTLAKVSEYETAQGEEGDRGLLKRGSEEERCSSDGNKKEEQGGDAELIDDAIEAVYERIPRVAFNLGIQQMACGNIRSAFESFHTAASGTPEDPTAWIRLAECYCLEHQKWDQQRQEKIVGLSPEEVKNSSNGESSISLPLQHNILDLPHSHSDVSASGTPGQPSNERSNSNQTRADEEELEVSWRVIALNPPASAAQSARDEGESLLQKARCSIMNAQYLVQESRRRQSEGNKGKEGEAQAEEMGKNPLGVTQLGILKTRELCHADEAEGICATLTCYVELCLGNMQACLSAGKKALSCEERALADKHRLAAAMYMAEALFLLGRPSDAQALLLGVGEHGNTGPMIRTNLDCIAAGKESKLLSVKS